MAHNINRFHKRVITNSSFAIVIISVSLAIGIIGYAYFGELSYIDALLNASMILTGMGPVNTMQTNAGKIFASVYALFSGIVFLSSIAIFLSPLIHKFMRDFHLEDKNED